MDDLISRKALLEKVQFRIEPYGVVGETIMKCVEITRRLIMEAPAVDAPVVPGHDNQYNIAEMAYKNGYAKGFEDGQQKSEKTGSWITYSVGHGAFANNWVECSECHTCGSPQWKRCPVCETRMNGGA